MIGKGSDTPAQLPLRGYVDSVAANSTGCTLCSPKPYMLVDVGSIGHSDQVVLHLQTRHESCLLMRQEAQCAPNFGPKDLVGCTERPKTATTALYPIDMRAAVDMLRTRKASKVTAAEDRRVS